MKHGLPPSAFAHTKSDLDHFMHRVVSGELAVYNAPSLRKKESARIQSHKSAKVADMLVSADLVKIRHQIDTLPEGFREQMRLTYIKKCDMTRQALQDSQCNLMRKFEKLIRKRWAELGLDFSKFRIGGQEKGLFELMYRIEPQSSMSKYQFIAVMRRFLEMDFDGPASAFLMQLFASFDLNESDSIDWRMFLCFMLRVVQPGLPCVEHMRISFALYACTGFLDIDKTDERVTMEGVKDLLVAAARLDLRDDIKAAVDAGWEWLCENDAEAIQVRRYIYITTPFLLL